MVMAPLYLIAGICVAISAVRSSSWPSVSGTVLSSQVVSKPSGRGVAYSPAIRYRYSVGGADHEGTRVWVIGDGISQGSVEAIVAKFPAGSTVPVFYDPSTPTRTVLVPGVSRDMALQAVIILVVTVVGMLVFPGWRLLRRPGPSPNHALQRTEAGHEAALDHDA